MSAQAGILTHTVEMTVADGTRMGGYVARPAAAGVRAGVIVTGELFGVSAHVRDVCERLAGFGYLVVAPDLYHRTAPRVELAHDPAGRERGLELLGRMTRAQVLDDVAAAIDYLHGQECARVGMVGLSVGGHIAYLAATRFDLAAVAILYGGWIPTSEIALSQPEPGELPAGRRRGRVAAHRGADAR